MTTSTKANGPVAVGFDGTARSVAALEYAAAEAVRRNAPLRVIHVTPSYDGVRPERAAVDREIASARRAVAASVTSHTEQVAVDLDIDLRHPSGAPRRRLLDEAADAQLVVLGREHKHLVDRAVTGGTTAAVASRALAPTVVVPEGWAGGPRARPVVVVGLKADSHLDALLHTAFEHAAGIGADVRIIEVEPYDDDAEDRAFAGASAAIVAEWRRAYPDLHVRVDAVEDRPADGLLRACADADALYVLRRRSVLLPPHLGRVARAVLRHAACPVVVVPPTAQ